MPLQVAVNVLPALMLAGDAASVVPATVPVTVIELLVASRLNPLYKRNS
jgi:hypothetical protein